MRKFFIIQSDKHMDEEIKALTLLERCTTIIPIPLDISKKFPIKFSNLESFSDELQSVDRLCREGTPHQGNVKKSYHKMNDKHIMRKDK